MHDFFLTMISVISSAVVISIFLFFLKSPFRNTTEKILANEKAIKDLRKDMEDESKSIKSEMESRFMIMEKQLSETNGNYHGLHVQFSTHAGITDQKLEKVSEDVIYIRDKMDKLPQLIRDSSK